MRRAYSKATLKKLLFPEKKTEVLQVCQEIEAGEITEVAQAAV